MVECSGSNRETARIRSCTVFQVSKRADRVKTYLAAQGTAPTLHVTILDFSKQNKFQWETSSSLQGCAS